MGPFIFREREQMQWAPSCSRPGLASILGRSLPALLAVPNSFPEQSWDNLVFSKSRKHLWRIKKKNGERSKVSRGKSAKTTISSPRGWLFSYSAPALPRTLPQAQARKQKKGPRGLWRQTLAGAKELKSPSDCHRRQLGLCLLNRDL